MYADFSLQRIKSIEARAFLDLQSIPLILRYSSKDAEDGAWGQIVLHLEDAALAADLVDAINGAVAKHSSEKQIATDADAA